jgi:hypothetical protein
MRIKSVLLLFVLLITGCYNENKPDTGVPERLLPEDTMVMVLTEIHLAEGAINIRYLNYANNLKDRRRFYAYIYDKFNLTPKILKENLDYYNSNPPKMVKIYENVLARLTEIQGNLETEKRLQEERIKDSLANIDTNKYVRRHIKTVKKPFDIKKIWPTPW